MTPPNAAASRPPRKSYTGEDFKRNYIVHASLRYIQRMARASRIMFAILGIILGAIAFPAVMSSPSRTVIVGVALGAAVFYTLGELLARREERKRKRERIETEQKREEKQIERERRLILSAIAEYKKSEKEAGHVPPVYKGRAKTYDSANSLLGPLVYPKIKSQNDGFYTKTEFLLTNHGSDVAHKLRIEPLNLRSGSVEFSEIEILEPGDTKEILPTVTRTSVLFKNNLSSILMREWDEARQAVSEYPLHMHILYEDVSHNEFETAFDLVYLPIQDILEQAAFDVRNVEIRPLAQHAAT